MDIKVIKGLISLFENSKLNTLEISEREGDNDFSVKMDKGVGVCQTIVAPAISTTVPSTVPLSPVPKGNAPIEYSEGVVDFNRVEDIKSPMVGVFYSSGSPEDSPFVIKGSKVKKGDTLCIIEAMKLMNEIVAERDGEIVEVVAKNGALVEFGQVLFRIL